MTAGIPARRIRYVLLALMAAVPVLIATLALGLHHPRVRFFAHPEGSAGRAGTLRAYAAGIQAQPIEGLQRNASGLTYSTASGTLFTVINRPAMLAELSTDGRLLRRIALPGLSDPEGITHVAGDMFLVSSESDQALYWLRVAPHAGAVRIVHVSRPALGFTSWHNLGLEGISWDEARRTLLLVNEQFPKRVLRIRGLEPEAPGPDAAVVVQAWRPRGWLGVPGLDLASVTTRGDAGNLLLLSEASALVSEYSAGGDLLGVLPLWAGHHGLAATVPQPEGIAVGPDDAIYVISEPNLFYRFVPATGPGLQGTIPAPG